jgi:hypothetical protein
LHEFEDELLSVEIGKVGHLELVRETAQLVDALVL